MLFFLHESQSMDIKLHDRLRVITEFRLGNETIRRGETFTVKMFRKNGFVVMASHAKLIQFLTYGVYLQYFEKDRSNANPHELDVTIFNEFNSL